MFYLQLVTGRMQGKGVIMCEGRHVQRKQRFGKAACQALVRAYAKRRIDTFSLLVLGPAFTITIDIETLRLRVILGHEMDHGDGEKKIGARRDTVTGEFKRIRYGPGRNCSDIMKTHRFQRDAMGNVKPPQIRYLGESPGQAGHRLRQLPARSGRDACTTRIT